MPTEMQGVAEPHYENKKTSFGPRVSLPAGFGCYAGHVYNFGSAQTRLMTPPAAT